MTEVTVEQAAEEEEGAGRFENSARFAHFLSG